MNDTTRKFPRTLNEAFGPYQDGPIHDPDAPLVTLDEILTWLWNALAVIGMFCAAVIVAMMIGYYSEQQDRPSQIDCRFTKITKCVDGKVVRK